MRSEAIKAARSDVDCLRGEGRLRPRGKAPGGMGGRLRPGGIEKGGHPLRRPIILRGTLGRFAAFFDTRL